MIRSAAVGCALAVLATLTSAAAQELTSHHLACEISAGENGGRICWLPRAKTRLMCDLSVGQPRPQCVTRDGLFADCVYHVDVPGDAPTVYCALPEKAEAVDRRIVLTDADFGGAKEIVRRRTVPQPVEEPPVLPALPGQRAEAGPRVASEETYRGVLRSCEGAWENISAKITQAIGNDGRSGVVGSMAEQMRIACQTPRGIVFSRQQRGVFCEHVTGWVQSLGLQVMATAESIRHTYRRVLAEACEP